MAPTYCFKKNWPNWDKFWYKLLANWSFSQEGVWFREGTCHLRVPNDICCPCSWVFYRANIELYECRVKIWNYSGFVWPFLCINWVSGHLMWIIQIWTTSTCSSAPRLVENITCVSLGEFICPMQEMEWNSNIWASWLSRKHWETWFLNSCKPQTRLQIMKLGMVSFHGINLPL